MKNLIVYASTHGCAEGCADRLREGLAGDTTLINIRKDPVPDLRSFDTVVVGGSIHVGKIQKRIRKFCGKNVDLLTTRKLGLFLCCMEEGETAEKQLSDAFPDALRAHATARGLFGGAFDFDRMNAVEKAIIRKAAGVEGSVSNVSGENIRAFIDAMNA